MKLNDALFETIYNLPITKPKNPTEGDVFFNRNTGNLYVYTNGLWGMITIHHKNGLLNKERINKIKTIFQ